MDDDTPRNRLLIYSLARFGGLADLLPRPRDHVHQSRPHRGWPQLGAIVAILGAIYAMFPPRLLKREWDRQDQGRAKD